MALPRPSCASGTQKRILVSSPAMTKGLFLARAFYLAGHTVIGLDFRRNGIPSSGGWSRVFSKYIEISKPSNSNEYTSKLKKIIEEENIDLWICVSGVETTTWDAIAKARIEDGSTSCKVFQFEQAICEILDDKYRFIERTKAIGLNTPKTKRVTSVQEVLGFLRAEEAGSEYILKALHLDDVSRADMTKYSRSNMDETRARISRLDISAERPWILQEFVEGDEYCTHSVVVDGCVKAFVCCPSSDLLMHYQASPTYSTPHSAKILEFTQDFVRGLAKDYKHLTGQLSFDFIVKKKGENDLQLYPIECNPRTHTAVVLFGRDTTRLANCYLSLLDDPGLPPPTTEVYIPDTTFAGGFYWIGHDIVSLGLLPLFRGLERFCSALWKHARHPNDTASETWNPMPLWALIEHLLCWKDATFEVWDPVPFWVLYQVYWPCMFALSLLTGKKWSRINVSTTRVFQCN